MLKRFSPRDLIFIALIGALIFSISLLVGVSLIAITGTPMTGGLITNLIIAYILAIALLVLRKFGAATLILLIHTILSIPTINFGPPGFYKPFIGLFIGLIADSILWFGKYKKGSYYLAAGIGFLLAAPILLLFLIIFGLPGADKLTPLITVIMGIYLVEALIGTWLAILTYEKKFKKSKLVKLLKS